MCVSSCYRSGVLGADNLNGFAGHRSVGFAFGGISVILCASKPASRCGVISDEVTGGSEGMYGFITTSGHEGGPRSTRLSPLVFARARRRVPFPVIQHISNSFIQHAKKRISLMKRKQSSALARLDLIYHWILAKNIIWWCLETHFYTIFKCVSLHSEVMFAKWDCQAGQHNFKGQLSTVYGQLWMPNIILAVIKTNIDNIIITKLVPKIPIKGNK